MSVTNAQSYVSIQIVQRQPFAGATNLPISGPNTGPQTPNDSHMQIPYATRAVSYISAIVVPPVARDGAAENAGWQLKDEERRHVNGEAGRKLKQVENEKGPRLFPW